MSSGKTCTDEQREAALRELLPGDACLRLLAVRPVNFDPHPFTVGEKCVVEAADHHSGMLTEEVCAKIGCEYREPGHPRCGQPPSAHTHDTVAFMQLTRDATQDEAKQVLLPLIDTCERTGIDGFAFVESMYRFTDTEKGDTES